MEVEALRPFLPAAAYPTIERYLGSMEVRIKVVRSRTSKFGDYRSGRKGSRPQITVNNDLNPYSFLVTLVHELAHFTTFERAVKRIKPHGEEWQQQYRTLLRPFITSAVFPADLLEALEIHLRRAPASSCSDVELMRVLHRYDHKPGRVFVEDLPEGASFRLNGKAFIKGPRLRKRYKCLNTENKRVYFVDPLAEALPIKEKNTALKAERYE